ncbi:MAG: glycosyltransferase family 2 protein [Bacteroidales bacterium]|nr:glycosyltransferase family 2 protein [Bacteroidales bacterium]
MKLAVVILNWNGRSMLERFLPSVVKYSLLSNPGEAGWQVPNTPPLELESQVIVADNGSTDDSVAFLRERYPDLPLILLDRNYGFAEGYNRALLALQPQGFDYYVLLNSDVECTPHWLQPVVAMMERDWRVAVAQPKLLMYDRKTSFEYAGAAGGFIDTFGYPFCRGRLFTTLERDHGQYDDEADIFWASGAAMFVKSVVWHKVGGLDGDFFAHMEEIDFCWRVKNAGYRVRYCPRSTVYHVGGGTLPKSSPFKTQLNFRNNLAMLYKNLPASRVKRVIRLRMVLDWLAAVKFLCGGHMGEFLAVGKAHREYREQRHRLAEKRAALHQHNVSSLYQGRILPEYYLLRRKTFTALRGRFVR